MGYVVLQGGNEFKGQMRWSDLRALELCGGMDAPVVIIAAAAAPDANHQQAGENGRRWFESLGARNVTVSPLIDRISAQESEVAASLERARLIYLLGGFPGYLAQTLRDSVAWAAIRSSLARGSVLAGSSAGAMVVCSHLFDPQVKEIVPGLGAIANCCVLPHHNTFGQLWAPLLQKELPQATLIGIDEETGMVSDSNLERWQVLGGGKVTLYIKGAQFTFTDGKRFRLPDGREVK
ncbi:MAG: Type 1 glutamine amidotransferase-like domain-containing protein [Desulfobacteraceae bacterium]|nr:Type 1 glutamine amidotransferase-like domain-containing protein [Desulfobacteraceae bacterium]